MSTISSKNTTNFRIFLTHTRRQASYFLYEQVLKCSYMRGIVRTKISLFVQLKSSELSENWSLSGDFAFGQTLAIMDNR
jgi:hypothetical protein